MKSLNFMQFSLGLFCFCLIHHVSGQRTIDTVLIGSNKYFFSDTTPYSPRLNWFLAYQYCRDIGMDLLTFRTNEEFNELSTYLENNGKSFNSYWTSGNQLGLEMWMWMTTGRPFNVTFNYWAEGGPPLTKSVKGCMQVQSSVWSAANCMDNNAFICQLTRCYYFDYAVTNRINSSQGSPNEEDNTGNAKKLLTTHHNKDETTKPLSSENSNPNVKPFQNHPVKLLQQRNSNPSHDIQNPQTQQSQPLFHNPGNQKRIAPPNQANEIIPKQVPFLSREILPPFRNPEAGSSSIKNPATETLNKNANLMRRLQRKEEFSWAFA